MIWHADVSCQWLSLRENLCSIFVSLQNKGVEKDIDFTDEEMTLQWDWVGLGQVT